MEKMKYDKKTIALIKQAPERLTATPCRSCPAEYNGSCCGCAKHRKYKAVIDEYNNAGVNVLEIARAYKKYIKAKKNMEIARLYFEKMGIADLID